MTPQTHAIGQSRNKKEQKLSINIICRWPINWSEWHLRRCKETWASGPPRPHPVPNVCVRGWCMWHLFYRSLIPVSRLSVLLSKHKHIMHCWIIKSEWISLCVDPVLPWLSFISLANVDTANRECNRHKLHRQSSIQISFRLDDVTTKQPKS